MLYRIDCRPTMSMGDALGVRADAEELMYLIAGLCGRRILSDSGSSSDSGLKISTPTHFASLTLNWVRLG